MKRAVNYMRGPFFSSIPFFEFTFILVAGLLNFSCQNPDVDVPPPNILWITTEDISPNLGVYGDEFAYTPNLDVLAASGVTYTNAFATAPVCAVARSSIITGMYSPSIGTQHMRCEGRLPEGAHLYPAYLKESGYYVTNNSKTDYNLDLDPRAVWDESSNNAHWRNRTLPEQPFFSIFNFTTTHESRVNREDRYLDAIAELPEHLLKKAGEVPLPAYYPDTENVRTLWMRYYNIISAMDRQVGELLTQLEEDGLAESTIVMFYSDHGAGLPRHKRWSYDSGLRVPLIVRVPEKYKNYLPYEPGSYSDELISFIDFSATALHLAGIPVPEHFQGRPFLGGELEAQREYIYAGRDRMDERYDMQRVVRSDRFKYIRYYEPYKPYTQYMNTPEKGAIMQAIRASHNEEALPEAGQHMVASTKPVEALYDLDNDPLELTNLASDGNHVEILANMRRAHADWSDRIMDTGLIPETILRKWESDYEASIYDIMRRQGVNISEIRETAVGDKSVEALVASLAHENEAVRYWAAIGLGNKSSEVGEMDAVEAALEDAVPAVRIAAARALMLNGVTHRALTVLEDDLVHEDEWVRLLAAQVLDELDEQARPSLDALEVALGDSNRYVVRVVNRAVNQLKGTDNVVP